MLQNVPDTSCLHAPYEAERGACRNKFHAATTCSLLLVPVPAHAASLDRAKAHDLIPPGCGVRGFPCMTSATKRDTPN